MTRSRPNILSHQIDTAEVDSEVEIDTALNTPSDHKSRSPSQLAPVIEERRRSGPSHLRRTSSTDDYDRNEDDELPSGTSTMFTAEKDGHEDSLEMRLSREGKEENHRNQMNGRGGVNEKRIKLDLGQGEEDIVIIDWLPGDPDNPFNWPDHRKYSFVGVATVITMATAINCTSTTVMATWGTEWFGVSRIQYILSFSIMMWSVSFTPMILAPISEVYGRNIIYQVTSVINAVLFIPQATSHSYAGLLTARFFQGMASSVGNSMVGGTVADLFHAEDRGLAMNIFALMVFVGQSLGAGAFGWIGMYHGIQWCYGVQAILAGVSILLNILVLRETRGDVLLSRRAKRLTKETGVKHMCAAELQKKSFKTLLTITAIRPFQYLVTEPIVAALSTWIAFAWACVFLGGTSYILVFSQYGWNVGQASSVQFTVLIGGVLGFISNYHQEYLYARAALKPKNKGKSPPEARLYWAAYGGLMFPLSTFVFAWTGGRDDIHWIVPAIFLTIGNWGIYCMYSGVFNYLADAYETYSSSAQAAQSFARNIFSGAFPLFARQMYVKLGYPQASTLVASIATVLAAAPILLITYGKQLRAHSRVASALAKDASHR